MGKVIEFRQQSPSNRGALRLLAGCALIGGALGVAPKIIPDTASAQSTNSNTISNCRVVDGDTLNCGGERIRLLGIDAPELPGHCAARRECALGNPFESTEWLSKGVGGSTLKIERVGTDRYGRTLAMVSGVNGDLSCWQLVHGAAIYKPRWDNGGRVANACPAAAR